VTIAFEDLLIGATALQLSFGVITGNTRHFEQIPGLKIGNVL
jgi:predicted nucleic acid-binding protein